MNEDDLKLGSKAPFINIDTITLSHSVYVVLLFHQVRVASESRNFASHRQYRQTTHGVAGFSWFEVDDVVPKENAASEILL
jgi:hypothetical protein